jgi:hypothetical protein
MGKVYIGPQGQRVELSGAGSLDSVQSFPLAGEVDDLAVENGALASSLLLNASAAFNLNGLAGGYAQREIILVNQSAFDCTVVANAGTSTAGNRFAADATIAAGSAAHAVYNGSLSQWVLISGGSGDDPVVPGSPTGSVQFNDGGTFAGDADFTWIPGSPNRLNIGAGSIAGALRTEDNGAGAAGAITIQPGASTGAIGAAASLVGGAGGATNAGGAVTITGGAGGATSGNGGAISINGGTPVDGNGGVVNVTPGSGVGTNRNGGAFNVFCGNSTGSGNAGGFTVLAGSAAGTGQGGAISLSAGSSNDGDGRTVTLTASNGNGTNRSAGGITLNGGTATGSGTPGRLILLNMTATGGQTATFTATNKPGAGTGAPTLWLRVDVAGTIYWVPLFAN